MKQDFIEALAQERRESNGSGSESNRPAPAPPLAPPPLALAGH